MTLRVKDILNLPDAIQNELETRSRLKAEALAHNIVNKFTGNKLPPNPTTWNPYLEDGKEEHSDSTSSNSTNGWGSNGW